MKFLDGKIRRTKNEPATSQLKDNHEGMYSFFIVNVYIYIFKCSFNFVGFHYRNK